MHPRRWPSTLTGRPFSNPIFRYVGFSGASFQDFVQANASSGGSTFGSSSAPPSMLRPQRFSSMENGLFLLAGTSMPCFCAYSMAASRVMFRSRCGAMIFSSGASPFTARSKRTWSLPLPVAPCATASAPCLRAAATRWRAMSGRESAAESG